MNNMMRKNNNRGGGNKHRSGSGGGGQRRYGNNSGGGNGGGSRSGANDSQNIQRQKHHATQQHGKYSDLARNAQINGDRVDVEYYLQHVDHYTRILTDIAAIEAERHAQQREAQIIPGGPNDPNAQQHHQDAGQQDAQGGNEQQQSHGSESHQGGNEQQAEGQQQSRPRQPRRQHQEPSDNGAREANANHEEIPLPGNILPPI
jgi:hypothetical protein